MSCRLRVAVVGVLASGCAAQPFKPPPIDIDEGPAGHPGGSGTGNPLIVEYDQPDDLWALSDPHGGVEALQALLSSARLIDASSHWSGGRATLVVVGDLIDKGDHSLEVIDLLRGLQPQARAAGGQIIVTMGNHEAEFLYDPENKKATSTGKDADGIDNELRAAGVSPTALASGTDAEGRGKWIRSMPFAARLGGYFFAHGGNTDGASIADLKTKFTSALRGTDGIGDQVFLGDHSILEDQGWYGDPTQDSAGRSDAEALGVAHIVFGHDPGAFNEPGHIAVTKNTVLIKIDCAMGLDGNPGQLLHVHADSAEKFKLSGATETLY